MHSITIVAKPLTHQQSVGWVCRLGIIGKSSKVRYTSGKGPAGRLIHLVKGDEDYVQFLQDHNQNYETKLNNLTPEKLELIKLLEKSGVVTIKTI